MPRSHWLPVCAAVGIALATQVQAQGIRHDARGGSPTANSKAKPKGDQQPSPPIAVQDDIHSIARALETANDRKPSSTDERNAKAQEKVADWTPWLFGVAGLEMLVTAAGVWLVYRTLVHTKRAADAARDAVDEARAATQATREVGKAQVRAYLTCEGANFAVERDWMVCRPRIKNYGNSPASNVRLCAAVSSQKLIFVPQQAPKSEIRESKDFAIGCAAVPAGGEGRGLLVWTHVDMGGQHDDIANENVHFWIIGSLEWTDVFGDQHRSIFNLSPARPEELGISGNPVLRSGTLSAFNHDIKSDQNQQKA